MKIDNSAMMEWFKCPLYYKLRRMEGLEKITDTAPTDFGTRVHQLLENRLRGMQGLEPVEYPPASNAGLEAEAQVMFAAYEAFYPVEEFQVLDVERVFELPLPGSRHLYCGKFDAIGRLPDGRLCVADHKTERRGGKGNLPAAWAVRSQAGLYTWAAQQLYPGEEVAFWILDILTRQSPAGREPATFRRDHIMRSPEQVADAVANITWVADQIEATVGACAGGEWWPSNRNKCVEMNWKCEFFDLCNIGRDESTLRLYKQAEEYLGETKEGGHVTVAQNV